MFSGEYSLTPLSRALGVSNTATAGIDDSTVVGVSIPRSMLQTVVIWELLCFQPFLKATDCKIFLELFHCCLFILPAYKRSDSICTASGLCSRDDSFAVRNRNISNQEPHQSRTSTPDQYGPRSPDGGVILPACQKKDRASATNNYGFTMLLPFWGIPHVCSTTDGGIPRVPPGIHCVSTMPEMYTTIFPQVDSVTKARAEDVLVMLQIRMVCLTPQAAYVVNTNNIVIK